MNKSVDFGVGPGYSRAIYRPENGLLQQINQTNQQAQLPTFELGAYSAQPS